MVLKKYMIIYLILTLMVVGCKSTTQETTDSTDTSGAVVEILATENEETTVIQETNDNVDTGTAVDIPETETEEIVVITTRPEIEVPVVEENEETTVIQETNDSVDTGTAVEIPETEEIVVITKRPEIEVPVVEEKVSDKPTVEEEPKSSNWYIGLVAEDPSKGLKTNSAQLGILEESDAVIKHTLISSGRFAGSYLDIVFVDPDGVTAGVYKTNYHTYQKGIEEHWRFTVKTDDVNAEIFLSWRGLYVLTPYTDDKNRELYKEVRSLSNPLVKYMKLIDVDTGVEKAVIVNGDVQTYVFNMNGKKERVFEWVVQNEVVPVSPQTNKLVTRRGKSIQKDIAMEEPTAVEQRAESFDLSKPPIFKEDHE